MGYSLVIHGLYWGFNPLTNLLPASWDIQVVSAAHTNRFFDASYLRIPDPSTVSPQTGLLHRYVKILVLNHKDPCEPTGIL